MKETVCMKQVKQLFVVLPNEPGSSAKLTRILKKKRIAIYAIAMFVDSARLHLSDAETAMHALHENGYTAEIRKVLEILLPNKQGAMAEMTQKLGNAGINIEYMFGTIEKRQKHGRLILEVDNSELALKLFKNHKF